MWTITIELSDPAREAVEKYIATQVVPMERDGKLVVGRLYATPEDCIRKMVYDFVKMLVEQHPPQIVEQKRQQIEQLRREISDVISISIASEGRSR